MFLIPNTARRKIHLSKKPSVMVAILITGGIGGYIGILPEISQYPL
jgi:hypothetical protein